MSAAMNGTPKRRRVNTCTNCRRRKVQCDQGVPTCGRCLRTGQVETCQYQDDTIEVRTRNGTGDNVPLVSTPVNVNSSPSATQQTIKKLEQELASVRRELALSNHVVSYPHRPKDDVAPAAVSGVKGKSFKTRYFGPSYPKSGLAPAVAALSKEIVESNPVLAKIRKDIPSVPDDINVLSPADPRIDLLSLLPSQLETDSVVKLYLETFDNVYHIIHRADFEAEYTAMWAHPDKARPPFLALVILICAVGDSLSRKEFQYIGKSSTTRQRALNSIKTCEEWHRVHFKQKKSTITDFQIQFLICLAKAVHGSQFKSGWRTATNTLRSCMAAGLHVEPSRALSSTSTMEQEMRRRIWWAHAEFELETSFVRGMPADPLASESDVAPPTNVQDGETNSAFGSVSYLVLSSSSFSLRHRMSHILNSTKTISFEEARGLTEQIQMHIQQIPEWSGSSQAEVPRALLKTNLLNYLLTLHTRQLQISSGADRDYSINMILRSSTEIMEMHTSLLSKGVHVLQQLSHQELRPALSIAYLIEKLDPMADRVLYHALKEFAEQVTSAVVQVVSDKALLGAGRNKMWLALVADAFVKIWLRPNQRTAFIQEAVNRVATNTYKVIASQAPSERKLKGLSAMNGSETVGTVAHHPTRDTLHVPGLGDDEISALDIDEFSAWTFDEWALESQHLGAFDVGV